MNTVLSGLFSAGASHFSACLEPARLCGYIDGSLTPGEQRGTEGHLLDCRQCRRMLAYAALPEAASAASRLTVAIRLVVQDVLGAIDQVFEASLAIPGACCIEEATPVFRGEAGASCVELVHLGPYRLQIRRVADGPEAGLYVRVTKHASPPIQDYSAEVELASGRHVRGQADASGWIRLDGVGFEDISSISIQSLA